jgi:Sulfatase
MATDPVSSRRYNNAAHWLRTAVIALGLTNIVSYWMASALISPRHLTVYHWNGPIFALFAPVWLDIAGIWLVAGLMLFSTRLGKRWRRVVWVGILVTLPALVVVSFNLGVSDSELVLGVGSPSHNRLLYLWLYGISPLVWIAVLACWRSGFDQYFERLVRFVEVVLMFAGVAGAVLLAQLAWFNSKAIGLNQPGTMHTRATKQAAKPRIVWLVMDELSYQQLYERRYPGLELPAFDRLAAESAVFTRVIPVGFYTDHIMPALISGRPVEEIRSSAEGRLWTREQSPGEWRPYNQYDTVFQDALENGYSTGLVGWWNPYCRTMPAVLDRCYWTAWFLEHKGLSEEATPTMKLRAILERSVFELGMILPNRVSGRLDAIWPDDKLHVAETYLDLSQQADKLLMDVSATFILLHIPIPHPVGIYNRATGQLSSEPTSYIDNLALCDLYLAHLRSALEARGEWDSTTLVVMGDHGWRTQIWKNNTWDATDEAASHGGEFDTRPGYIVKLPNQQPGARIDEPFHALKTRALFDALMSGQIRTEPDLEAWVRAHP